MQLSEFETEVMAVIWRLGECSAPAVHTEVAGHRNVTYSTVKTIIDRLEQKGAIRRTRNVGRRIFLVAVVQPAKLQSNLLDRMLNTVFAGDPRPLFSHLIQSKKLTREELDYLSELLKKEREELDDD